MMTSLTDDITTEKSIKLYYL